MTSLDLLYRALDPINTATAILKESNDAAIKPRTNFQYGRWVAVDDNTHYYSDDPMGFGPTEQAAIDDLRQVILDREEDRKERAMKPAPELTRCKCGSLYCGAFRCRFTMIEAASACSDINERSYP